MGLNSPFMASRTQAQIRNGVIALVTQVLSMILAITGITEIRFSFTDSDVDMGDASDLVPWLTAVVIVFCVSVVLVDVYAFYGLLKDEAAVYCQRNFTFLLHGFNLFSTMFVSLCTLALAIGYVIKGLGESGLLSDDMFNTTEFVFYGLTAAELLSLYQGVDRYLQGAWLILIGAFISIPAQAWILAAMSVQVSFQEARQTMYKGGGASTKQTRATPVAFYNAKDRELTPGFGSERVSLIGNAR
eukprot:m.63161 g.63161  ORF g.63161 m.63161 type:complete len:244 (-) comp23249_c1_seq1:257-988(-)